GIGMAAAANEQAQHQSDPGNTAVAAPGRAFPARTAGAGAQFYDKVRGVRLTRGASGRSPRTSERGRRSGLRVLELILAGTPAAAVSAPTAARQHGWRQRAAYSAEPGRRPTFSASSLGPSGTRAPDSQFRCGLHSIRATIGITQ